MSWPRAGAGASREIKINPRTMLLILVCVVLLTSGQVVWKAGLDKMGGFNPAVRNFWSRIAALCTSPLIVVGALLYIAATLLWLNVLSNAPLSVAYPLMSISYVLGVLAAMVFFKESVPLVRWFGISLVCLGIYFIAQKGS